MSEPTLDGLTTAQLLSLAEEAAVRYVTIASASQGVKVPAQTMADFRMGAVSGANAMLQELINRGVIKPSVMGRI